MGIHLYRNAKAIFQIKIAGLFKLVDASGKEMNQGETVTVLNDMCFLAPATLISKNISWEIMDPLTIIAKFTNESEKVAATLYFNEAGELINFISNDRFETSDGKTYQNYPWMTPATGYRDINGSRLVSGAKLIYRHPGEDFCYGEFELVNLEYNTGELK